ncbi:DUF1513 domain-containing protein [Amphritea pacifica]|uniref:DUF1513 domain-containing protein n=1 Tax=Amphritea pacifica TaxID=2811233 RepID=A0ABS2W2G7_9GAMM|nr:DUF1513 domain-containing protein [Amphritea pacifica]MBN0985899.1 DUF1513 domain-containing protein [Amphritea pacifica]
MEINRRRFCQLLGSAILLPRLALAEASTANATAMFTAAAKGRDGHYHLYLIGQQGELMLDHILPARAHHTEVHPQLPLLACIARRPGTFIDIVDYQQQRLVKRIIADRGRHFFGHGIFSDDGRWLITTENEINSGQGRVVIRAMAQDYAIIADYPSYGIGPHELVQQPGSAVLTVANGGILTHPDHGREKLNLDSMQPSLVRLDLRSGNRLEQQQLPAAQHQLSIRHIDTNHQGTTVIALQYQGAPGHNLPLVGVHRPGEALQLLRAPDPVNLAMKDYCGSARCDHSGRFAAVSAPRGGLITFWDLQKNQFISSIRSRDGCGLAATDSPAEFIISAGTGRCVRYNLEHGTTERLPLGFTAAWDNHLTALL